MYRKITLSFLFSIIFGLLSLAQNFAPIDSIIHHQIATKNISGGTAMIIYKGKVLYDKAFGQADLASQTPMKTDAIFRIASQTKAIVSVAFLQLVEQNKIGLDEPLEKYIPAFATQRVAKILKDTILLENRNRSITPRDLLSHQSGISSSDEYPKLNSLFAQFHLNKPLATGFSTLEEEMEMLAQMPLAHQPGERFSYGLSTNVIGRLIEIISHESLDQYLRKHIFQPLKMEDTYFYLPANKKSRLVKVYMKNAKDSLLEVGPSIYPVDFPLQEKQTYFAAIGGLVSTTHDYAKFLTCLLNQGRINSKTQLLSPAMIDQLTSNQLGEKTFIFGGKKSLNNFGLGVGLTTSQGTVINHASPGSYFWGGAFNTAYMVDPKRELITLFYFQRVPFVLTGVLSLLEKTTIDILSNAVRDPLASLGVKPLN